MQIKESMNLSHLAELMGDCTTKTESFVVSLVLGFVSERNPHVRCSQESVSVRRSRFIRRWLMLPFVLL
jgi:hypothetical protein